MYCSIHEAWPDFTKSSPGINPHSTDTHHNMNNQIEHYNPNHNPNLNLNPNPNAHDYKTLFNKELRPELVNNAHYGEDNYASHRVEKFKETSKTDILREGSNSNLTRLNQSNKMAHLNHLNQLSHLNQLTQYTNPENNHNHNHKQFSSKLSCNEFLNHLEECEECRIYISNRYSKSNKLVDILATNPQLKETLMVFLIGILVLMVLNLFYK
jgi:hypothetical protein